MGKLKAQYEQIVSARKELTEQINALSVDETVKTYLEAINRNNALAAKQRQLHKQIKTEEYQTCHHIWVNTFHFYDSYEGRGYNYSGCVKCGLDRKVFYLKEKYRDLDLLTEEERIMYDFIKSNGCQGGTKTDLSCDLDLAKAIYKKIKEACPNINDQTAIKYLEVALEDIRNNKVSDERKENRAKRLSLKPDFNKWTVTSIQEH